MPDTPPFAIVFHGPYREPGLPGPPRDPQPVDGDPRPMVYRQALALAARAFEVAEHASDERFHLRDQLDRKAALVPQLIAQGLAIADMAGRRAIYVRARQLATDCSALFDLLGERDTVPPDALAPAAAIALALLDTLRELTVPPPRAR